MRLASTADLAVHSARAIARMKTPTTGITNRFEELWPAALAFGFAAVVVFWRLGELPLIDPDEGRDEGQRSEAGS